MKKANKYLLLALVVLLMAAVMTGCGKKKSTVTIDKDTIYREESVNIAFPEGADISRIIMNGDKLIFTGYSYDKNTWESKSIWGSINTDGSDMKVFEAVGEDGMPQYFDNVFVTDDGNVGMLYYHYEAPEEGDEFGYGISVPFIDLYSADGKKIKTVDMSEYADENTWMQTVNSYDGKIYVSFDSKVLIFDSNFKLEKEVKRSNGDYFDMFITLKDGSYAITKWDEDGVGLYRFDLAAYEVKDKIEIPFSISRVSIKSGGKSGYDLMLYDNTKIMGFNFGDLEPKTLVNFVDSDILYSYSMFLEPLGPQEFLNIYNSYDDDEFRTNVCKYVKVNPEDVVEKQVISLGCMYAWEDLKKNVIDFNKSSADVRITVIDYDRYNTDEDWQAGTKKFNSDIASGKGPDIIVMDSFSAVKNYTNKGLFADLYKFIDKDDEIDRNDLFPNVLESCSENGKLCYIAPTFNVQTLAAKKSLMGNRTSWTIKDLMEYEKTLPEDSKLMMSTTREAFLRQVLWASGTSFVDLKKGKCNFDSEEFVSLLEYVNTLPESIDYGEDGPIMYETYGKNVADDNYDTMWRNNRVILMDTYLTNLRDYNYIKKGNFGEDIVFIGYPTEEGNGSILSFGNMYAISSKSSNPNAAWQFIRQYFTPEAMSKVEYGIPLSMSRFDELAKEAMSRPYYLDDNGNKVEYDEEYYMNGEYITLTSLTQDEINEYKNFIMSVTRQSLDTEDILPIITEEADFYFNGQKSAKDVAGNIQQRVFIYINEKQ